MHQHRDAYSHLSRLVPFRFSVGGRIALETRIYKVLELQLESEIQLENGMKKQDWKERTNALARRRGTNSISMQEMSISQVVPKSYRLAPLLAPRLKAAQRGRKQGGGEFYACFIFESRQSPASGTPCGRPDQEQEQDLEEARYREWWETGRLSETNVGATKREGATGADGVREEPSAGCEIDTVVGQQEGCGAEREM
ncbi:hypothetical protein B0H13DRAFT_1903358 [Mycena leptocephala]|nr:hypothetical protein B0H13DRAFT_1903358 [Mycena leptocephala]